MWWRKQSYSESTGYTLTWIAVSLSISTVRLPLKVTESNSSQKTYRSFENSPSGRDILKHFSKKKKNSLRMSLLSHFFSFLHCEFDQKLLHDFFLEFFQLIFIEFIPFFFIFVNPCQISDSKLPQWKKHQRCLGSVHKLYSICYSNYYAEVMVRNFSSDSEATCLRGFKNIPSVNLFFVQYLSDLSMKFPLNL